MSLFPGMILLLGMSEMDLLDCYNHAAEWPKDEGHSVPKKELGSHK